MQSTVSNLPYTWRDLFLLFTLILAGFYGGTGFFVIMGGNPAIEKMSSTTFAEYWQHTDYYMAARMRFFGPLLLLCVAGSTLLCYFQHRRVSFWFMMGGLLFLAADLVIIFNFNHPLNKLIQSWDLSHLPANVQAIKHQVVHAFWFRSVCMTGSFALVVLAFWKRG